MFLCGFLLRHQELESVQSLDHSMKQTPPPPTPSLFIAVALNTPAMGYTNKGGKLQLTFIESAKKKNTCKHIIKGCSVCTCCLLLPCRASRGAPLRHPAPLCTPSSCAGPAYARPPPPRPIDCRARASARTNAKGAHARSAGSRDRIARASCEELGIQRG